MSNATAAAATAPVTATLTADKPTVRFVNPDEITIITDPKDPKFGPLAIGVEDRLKKDDDFKALVDSIKKEGFNSLTQCIQDTDGRLIAVTGRRRKLAAAEAGANVLAKITPVAAISSVDTFARMVRENEVRKDENPFVRAKKAEVMLKMELDRERPVVAETGLPDETWTPGRKQIGAANNATMLAFGFNPKTGSGKFSELLALNRLILKVKAAVLAKEISLSAVIAAGLHQLSEEAQEKKIDQMLARIREKGEKMSRAQAQAAKTTGTVDAVNFSKKELLDLADAPATPSAVKAWIWLTTHHLTRNQLGQDVAWLDDAQEQVRVKVEALKAAKEAEKAQTAEQKAVDKAAKDAAKQLKKQELAEARAAKQEAKKAAAESAKAATKAAKEAKVNHGLSALKRRGNKDESGIVTPSTAADEGDILEV